MIIRETMSQHLARAGAIILGGAMLGLVLSGALSAIVGAAHTREIAATIAEMNARQKSVVVTQHKAIEDKIAQTCGSPR